MSKKEDKEPEDNEVDGASEIPSPDDLARFVSWWFTTSFKRAKSNKGKLAGEARDKLETLLVLSVNQLLAFARDRESPANAWAGKVLVYVDALIAADCKKLCETNGTYQQERRQVGKLLRSNVWFPKSPLYQALHSELWHCWYYRGELAWPLVQLKWEALEYQPFMKLPPLSLESFPRWEKELWKLVRKHNPDLLSKLREKAERKQVVPVHSGGVTKFLLKPLSLTWKLLRPQFHRHLKSIAMACG